MEQPTVLVDGQVFKVVSIFFKENGTVSKIRTNNFETLINYSEGENVKWFNDDGVRKNVELSEEKVADAETTMLIEKFQASRTSQNEFLFIRN